MSDDFETNLSKKTRSDALADKQKLSGCTDTEGIYRSAPEETGRHLTKDSHLRALSFHCHPEDDDSSQSARSPPPTVHTHSFYV